MSGKLKAIVLLGTAFILGAVSGVSWQRYRVHRWPERHSEMFAQHRLKRLTDQLHLTPDQEKTIGAIFEKAHGRATKVNDQLALDLAGIHRDSVSAIRQVLTPEQMARFEKMHDKYHTRHPFLPPDAAPVPPPDSHS